MRRLARVAIPLVVIVAVVGLLATVMDSSDPKTTPYLSALSDAFATPVLAAKSCPFRGCAGGSRFNLRCGDVTTATSCNIFRGTCLNGGC